MVRDPEASRVGFYIYCCLFRFTVGLWELGELLSMFLGLRLPNNGEGISPASTESLFCVS